MNIVIALVVLGVLIFIHELGHFLFAKWCGVYVEKFSLGFGPKLIGKKIGETEYCLSAFPLGGYVKMYGEDEEDTDSNDISKVGRAFTDKKTWQRALIVFAGPLFNILLAVVVFWGLFMTGFPDYEAIVGEVKSGSVAEISGIKSGDKIVAVDDKNVRSWGEFQSIISENPNKSISITLDDGRKIPVTISESQAKDVFGDTEVVGDIGVSLLIPAIIGSVQEGSPAEIGGLKSGDKIVSINNENIVGWNNSASYIRERPEELLTFNILRNNENITLQITPKLNEINNEQGEKISVGLVGITPKEGSVLVNYGFIDSMIKGFEKSWEFTALVFESFAKLIQRAVPADSLGGPIMIVQMTATSAESGMAALLTFMAIISLNLAIFNLLPIPVLDGGHLLIMAIESITRRKLSERIIGGFQRVGFALLMALMVFAFYNDIARFFK